MAANVEIVITGRDEASSVMSGVGAGLVSLGDIALSIAAAGFAALGAAIVGIGVGLKQSLDSAMESEVAIARLEGVIKATGGAAGLTSEQLQDMANQLQGVTRFSDETILSGASLLLTFRNIGEDTMPRTIQAMLDMAEVFGSVDASAMQLGKALNEPDAMLGSLTRAGVTFSDAQKEMIKNFVEMGDVASAQNIILTEVENQVGGLAEAMGDTFAGKVEILKNRFDEIKETIGNSLIPILQTLMDKFMEWMPTIEKLGETIAEAFKTGDFSKVYTEVNALVADVFAQIDWGAIVTIMDTKLAEQISGHDWVAAGKAFGDSITELLMSTPVVLPAENLSLKETILKFLLPGPTAVANFLNNTAFGVAISDAVAGWFSGVFNPNGLTAAQIQEWIDGIRDGIVDGFNNMAFDFGVWIYDNIVAPAKKALGIASPSTIFMDIGKDIIRGLVGGLLSLAGWAMDAIAGIVAAILLPFKPILDLLGIDTSWMDVSSTGSVGGGSMGGTTTTSTGGTGTMTGLATTVNQYFQGANIYVGSWDEIAYDCIYPNPFVAATSGQIGTTGGGTAGAPR
jgi:tail length tape measure protein